MARDRVDALDDRVRRLLVVTDHLREEHAAVRRRVRSLETAVDDSSDGCSAPTRARSDPGRSAANISASPAERSTTDQNSVDEATHEEVAAAIPAVEPDRDETADEERDDDILIA